jgi:hypothetical protein
MHEVPGMAIILEVKSFTRSLVETVSQGQLLGSPVADEDEGVCNEKYEGSTLSS